MDLALNVFILESSRINDIIVNHHLLLIIIGLHNMALLARKYKCDLLSSHAPIEETLNAGISMQSLPIKHTVLRSSSVGQRIHQSPTNAQVLVKVWVVDRHQALHALLVLGQRSDSSRDVAQGVQSLVLDTHSQN